MVLYMYILKVFSVSPENNKFVFMRLPQSQNNNVNSMCIVGNPVYMISKQEGIKSQPKLFMCHVDRLFLYHVTKNCHPPPFT